MFTFMERAKEEHHNLHHSKLQAGVDPTVADMFKIAFLWSNQNFRIRGDGESSACDTAPPVDKLRKMAAQQLFPSISELFRFFTERVLDKIDWNAPIKASARAVATALTYPPDRKSSTKHIAQYLVDRQQTTRDQGAVLSADFDHDNEIDFAEFCALMYDAWRVTQQSYKIAQKGTRALGQFKIVTRRILGNSSSFDLSDCPYRDLLVSDPFPAKWGLALLILWYAWCTFFSSSLLFDQQFMCSVFLTHLFAPRCGHAC